MATRALARRGWSAERRFYTGMALAIFAVVYVGFAPTYFLRPWFPAQVAATSPPEPYFYYVHGVVFTAWFAMLVVQPSLVGLGRTDLHRRAGRLGAVLAVAVVVTGVSGALLAARRPGGFVGIPVPAEQFLLVPLVSMASFAVLVGMAIARRNDVQSHKRLMLLGSIALVEAAFARWPVIHAGGPPAFFAATDALLLPLIAWDLRSRGRLHPATLWGGLAIIATQPLRLWLMGTAAWAALAARLV